MPSTSGPSDTNVFTAAYYDGQSATRHTVTVRLRGHALDIIDPDEDMIDQWLYADVAFVDQGSGGARVVNTSTQARLVFEQDAFDALRACAPQIHDRQKRARHGMVAAIAVTAAVLVGVYLLMPVLTAGLVALTPLSFEQKLGRDLSADIVGALQERDGKALCDDVAGGMALDKIGTELSRHTQSSMAYTVRVLDVESVNAMALPGGYIYVFRGLLEKAESDGELAGVLAHEMAHVDLRHPMHGLVRSYGMTLIAEMMFGGGNLGGLSNMMMLTSYSREAEEEADAFAIEVLDQAGVGAQGMATFFERLASGKTKDGFSLPEFLSTHPDTGMREQRARMAKQTGRPILTDREWAALRAMCE